MIEMNPAQWIRPALAAALATLAMQAAGQHTLEIVSLRHRTADQVLPALRPLLEPGGTLTGQGNQLIVRTSPANLSDLKRALEAIDRPLRRLQISVRFDDVMDAASRSLEVSSRGRRIEVRGHEAHSAAAERVDQRIQVLEGGRAYIMTGHTAPLAVTPETTVIRESGTGFEAIPRLSGDTVLLDIAPRRDALGQQQQLVTTLSARLGEWFEVGGTVANAPQRAESHRVWLKVEELQP
jgi:type II secretory pathway component GspD/PulD (secretin)